MPKDGAGRDELLPGPGADRDAGLARSACAKVLPYLAEPSHGHHAVGSESRHRTTGSSGTALKSAERYPCLARLPVGYPTWHF